MTNDLSPMNILRVDASMRRDGSDSRTLADELTERLRNGNEDATVVRRDLADGISLIDEAWIGANFTDAAERSDAQRELLRQSDTLVSELKAADTVIIATPIYNFGVPGALKAWIDLIARARETFRYSEEGPVGLLDGKKAYVVITSGGTEVGSDIDFASGYLRHVLGFVGIDDVTIVAADRLMFGAEDSLAAARGRIAAIGADDARAAA